MRNLVYMVVLCVLLSTPAEARRRGSTSLPSLTIGEDTLLRNLRKTAVNEADYVKLLDSTGAGIPVPSGEAHCFSISIFGYATAGTNSGKVALFTFDVVTKNVGGTTTLVGTNFKVNVANEVSGTWDARLVANDTTDELELQARGDVATTVEWRATVLATESP